ncbi:Phosphatidate phosphatase LPIN3, partial [Geodia barretti]
AGYTKQFLRRLTRGAASLPDGPLFSTRILVVHASKSRDVKSYTQVGIPRSRIFTVNYKGHLKYEISSTFQSTYMNMIEFVDAQFPPVGRRLPSSPSPPSPPPSPHSTREEYSTFNFWRTDLPHQPPFDL